MKYFNVISLIFLSGFILFSGCKKKTDPVPENNTVTVNSAITTNTTWSASKIYIIDGEVDVDNCTLTIEPGTTIKFNTNATIYFGYYNNVTVIANGTTDKHIKFTSSASSPVAGAWSGVYFSSHCLSNTSVTFCDFEYGGNSDNGIVNIAESKITFENCTVKYAKQYGIDLSYDGSFVSFANNTINNCASHAVIIKANYLHTLGANNIITTGSNLGIFVNGGNITNTSTGGLSSITWQKQSVPFYFTGQSDINNLSLTINPGCTFKFDANSSIWVGYDNNTTLIADGTDLSSGKITFTTSASSPAPGGWNGLYFSTFAQSGTKLNYCEISYGGYPGSDSDANIEVNTTAGNITVSNCLINNSQGWGMIISGNALSAQSTGNTYTGNTLGGLKP